VTGSKDIDIRASLIEHFRESASIMIATEAAAEGVNLQFCSLVVNYDLPWNPQRIEQRIGRCHRYGQKHDVVVINFLNRRNEADQRVFQLLSDKFRLFDGIFGASDEVLGALDSGVDFERRIADIYQNCRTPAEIDAAFDTLQQQLEEEIGARMASARSTLLENFDEDVRTRLRNVRNQTDRLDRFSRWLWLLTEHELSGNARFAEGSLQFQLDAIPNGCDPVPLGLYRLITDESSDGGHAYRAGHPLARFALERALERPLAAASVVFEYSGRAGKISLVEQLVGKRGVLALARVTISTLEVEDHLIFVAFDDSGQQIDQETCEKLFEIGGEVVYANLGLTPDDEAKLAAGLEAGKDATIAGVAARNARFFEEEIEKLERWAEDLKAGLEQELKDLDIEVKAAKRDARLQADLETKVALHRKAKELEAERSRKRRSLYEAQDEIDRRKEGLLADTEKRLAQRVDTKTLLAMKWIVR
jgi:adenine-specific DNA-methyltransferase